MSNPIFKWRQEGNKAIVSYPKGEVYFDMPKEWSLEKTHEDLLMLANYCLFSPFYSVPVNEHKFTRKPGKKIGLAFSGGVDSTAAMLLLEGLDMELFYHERTGFEKTMMKQDNALHLFNNMEKKVWRIRSNQEIIKEREAGKRGFSTDYCVGIAIILMADILDFGYFSTGQMMESTNLRRGYRYRPFQKTKFWLTFSPMFSRAGLTLLGPVFSCSEVITNKIVEQSKYKDLAQSCVRGTGGVGCNECYKCFRKNLIRGIAPGVPSFEVNYVLSVRPLKQAASLIYAMNKFKVNIPAIEEYQEMKLKFIEGYYPPILYLLPEKIRKIVLNNLTKYKISPMTSEDVKEMEMFDISK